MNGPLQVLRHEVQSDAQAFAERVEELTGLGFGPSTADPNLLARAAVALHHAYGALEAALARTAKVFDTEPTGAGTAPCSRRWRWKSLAYTRRRSGARS